METAEERRNTSGFYVVSHSELSIREGVWAGTQKKGDSDRKNSHNNNYYTFIGQDGKLVAPNLADVGSPEERISADYREKRAMSLRAIQVATSFG